MDVTHHKLKYRTGAHARTLVFHHLHANLPGQLAGSGLGRIEHDVMRTRHEVVVRSALEARHGLLPESETHLSPIAKGQFVAIAQHLVGIKGFAATAEQSAHRNFQRRAIDHIVVDAERREVVQVDAVARRERHANLLGQSLAIHPMVAHKVPHVKAQLIDDGLQYRCRLDDDLLVGQAVVRLHARHVGNERHLGTRTHAGILVSGDHDKCRAVISLRFNIKINRRTAQTNKDGEDDPIA